VLKGKIFTPPPKKKRNQKSLWIFLPKALQYSCNGSFLVAHLLISITLDQTSANSKFYALAIKGEGHSRNVYFLNHQ